MYFKVEITHASGFVVRQFEEAKDLEELQKRFNGPGIDIERLYTEHEINTEYL